MGHPSQADLVYGTCRQADLLYGTSRQADLVYGKSRQADLVYGTQIWSMGSPVKQTWSMGRPVKQIWFMGSPIKQMWSMGRPVSFCRSPWKASKPPKGLKSIELEVSSRIIIKGPDNKALTQILLGSVCIRNWIYWHGGSRLRLPERFCIQTNFQHVSKSIQASSPVTSAYDCLGHII